MKRLLSFIALCIPLFCFAQHKEFGKKDNELIYPDSTIKRLKFIVDSLNIKFKACEVSHQYYAQSQTKGVFIKMKGSAAEGMAKAIENKISIADFLKEYPLAEVEKDVLVTKASFKGKTYAELVPLGNKMRYRVQFPLPESNSSVKNTWLVQYDQKTTYSDESIAALYFTEEFSEPLIPNEYAKLIQYVDCMIDTSSVVTSNAFYYYNGEPESYQLKKFMRYVYDRTNKPLKAKFTDDNFEEAYAQWDSLRLIRVDNLCKQDTQFIVQLKAAFNDVKDNGKSTSDFETYVGRYLSKKAELQLKRNRKVVGTCSMDSSPRSHALTIAMLAAETASWDIFLRSHLDIMNDRFERNSDGNYAQEGRKTYLKELEVLDIEVLDLLLGMTLRIENEAPNHYYGNISRVGRALAESKDRSLLEEKLLQIIADTQLDDYNRVLFFYLFWNYNYNLEDKTRQNENKQRLQLAVNKLPSYIANKIELE